MLRGSGGGAVGLGVSARTPSLLPTRFEEGDLRGRRRAVGLGMRARYDIEATAELVVVLKVDRALHHLEVRRPVPLQAGTLHRRRVLVPVAVARVVGRHLRQEDEVVA
jgi:hypothetical protein